MSVTVEPQPQKDVDLGDVYELQQRASCQLTLRGTCDTVTLEQLAGLPDDTPDVFVVPPKATKRLISAAARITDKHALLNVLAFNAGAVMHVIEDEPGVAYAAARLAVFAQPIVCEHGTVVARLDRFADRSLVRRLPGAPYSAPLPADEPPRCDVCGSNRTRNDSFAYITAAGEVLQSGRCCMPDAVAKAADAAAKLLLDVADAHAAFDGMPASERLLPLQDLVTVTCELVSRDGYVKRTDAGDKVPTADRAAERTEELVGNGQRAADAVDDEHVRTAGEVIEYVRGEFARFSRPSDFTTKLIGVYAQDWVSRRDAGVACSAVSVFLRDADRRRQRAETQQRDAHSRFVGQVGDRVTVSVQVTSSRTRPNAMYGGSTVKFLDIEGNVLTWFSSHPADTYTPGDEFLLTGTVKKHEVFQDVQQTIVTRCKLRPIT